MSGEVRRISLKAVPIADNSTKSDNKKSSDSKTPKDPKDPKTKRFVLALNTDNEESNEFSFNDLIKQLNDKNVTPNGTEADDDPLVVEEEQSLRNLSKHFEDKYGPKKRRQYEDYIDKGMGYDETDPFIDNDEAYDELVPSTLTTQYGGFYINCGELEFRPLSPDNNGTEVPEEDEEDNIRPVIKRKRKLELMTAKRRRSSTELNQKNRKNIQKSGKTVAQMLNNNKKTIKTSIKPIAVENTNKIIEEIIELNDSDGEEEAVVVSASVRDVVDSVAKGGDQPNGKESKTNGSLEKVSEDVSKKEESIIAVKLPDNLPQELVSLIDEIKKLAKVSNDSKRSFFSLEVNQKLFDIERLSRSVHQNCRTQIYSHLSSYLPCSKQTLMTRVKKTTIESFEFELQTAMSQIKLLVEKLTQRSFASYQEEMNLAKEQFENNRQAGLEHIAIPRRVFLMTRELRERITSALNSKINLYESKTQTISLKEYLYDFLDKEIKPIFPKGWMSLENLKHKFKWIQQILPPEPQPTVPSQQSSAQSLPQTSHQTPAKQTSPQTQSNKVQTQQSSHEKVIKVQTTIGEKSKPEMESIERKLPTNTSIKSIQNSYQMSSKLNDNMSEGLGSKFMATPKEVKNNVSNDLNLVSIDLSTKQFNTPTARLSPINLKTSPTISAVKSEQNLKSSSPSPSVSPLAMNSILQSNKTEKSEKLSREVCLTKVIEHSLGNFPNSAVNTYTTNSLRNVKTSSLPQNSLPMNEMFAKGFNTPTKPDIKETKPEVCIEIASSPEPYTKVHPTGHQTNVSKSQTQSHSSPLQFSQFPHKTPSQQKSVNKPSMNSLISSSTSSSNLNYVRTSEVTKKKYNSSGSLIQPSNAQKEQEMRSNHLKMDQMLGQSSINVNNRTPSSGVGSRDTSISITPISQNKTNDNSLNTKLNSNSNSRLNSHSNSTNVITSTPSTLDLANPNMVAYLRLMGQMGLHSQYGIQNQMRYMDTSALFQSPQSPQTPTYYFPTFSTPTTNPNRTGSGGKDK